MMVFRRCGFYVIALIFGTVLWIAFSAIQCHASKAPLFSSVESEVNTLRTSLHDIQEDYKSLGDQLAKNSAYELAYKELNELCGKWDQFESKYADGFDTIAARYKLIDELDEYREKAEKLSEKLRNPTDGANALWDNLRFFSDRISVATNNFSINLLRMFAKEPIIDVEDLSKQVDEGFGELAEKIPLVSSTITDLEEAVNKQDAAPSKIANTGDTHSMPTQSKPAELWNYLFAVLLIAILIIVVASSGIFKKSPPNSGDEPDANAREQKEREKLVEAILTKHSKNLNEEYLEPLCRNLTDTNTSIAELREEQRNILSELNSLRSGLGVLAATIKKQVSMNNTGTLRSDSEPSGGSDNFVKDFPINEPPEYEKLVKEYEEARVYPMRRDDFYKSHQVDYFVRKAEDISSDAKIQEFYYADGKGPYLAITLGQKLYIFPDFGSFAGMDSTACTRQGLDLLFGSDSLISNGRFILEKPALFPLSGKDIRYDEFEKGTLKKT